MGGRPAKPIQLHLANGNKRHLSKAEIAARQKQESKLKSGTKSYKPSPQVKNDLVAHAMFKKLQKLYKDIEYVEGLDENVINRYCLLHSEYVRLREMRSDLAVQYKDTETLEQRLILTERILNVEKRIEKKMELLLKLEDRLFLNPTARIKNVPKKEPEKADPFGAEFD